MSEKIDTARPAKSELAVFIKLADLTDYLSTSVRSMSEIFEMAIKKKLIPPEEEELFPRAFERVTSRIKLFDVLRIHGYSCLGYKLKSGITKEKFRSRVLTYGRRYYNIEESFETKRYKARKASISLNQTTLW